jgi:hypothetical protein
VLTIGYKKYYSLSGRSKNKLKKHIRGKKRFMFQAAESALCSVIIPDEQIPR